MGNIINEDTGMEGANFFNPEFTDGDADSDADGDAGPTQPDLPTILQFATCETMREALTGYGITFDTGVAQSDGYHRIVGEIDSDEELSGDELINPIAAELASHFVQRFFGLSDEQFVNFISLNHTIYENAVLIAEIAIGTFFQQTRRFPDLNAAEDFRKLRAIYYPRQNQTSAGNERLKV